jgi:hypothetical protein
VLGDASKPATFNRFAYCLNDPINRIDKDGQWSFKKLFKSIVSAATAIIGNVIEAVVDTVVTIVKTAIRIVQKAVDTAVRFIEDVKEACDDVVEAVHAGFQVIQKAWDNLDSGLKQWIINGIAMAVSFIPIVGPILSCVIDGTFVDMFKAIMKGDWATVGLCALAFVPGMKGVGKSLKAFGAVEKGGGRLLKKSVTKETDIFIKKGTKVWRAGGPGGWEHGGSYTLKSLEGKSRKEIIRVCGIPTKKTGNPVSMLYEYRANQGFWAKARTSIGGTWPELALDRGQGEEVLDLVRATPIPLP